MLVQLIILQLMDKVSPIHCVFNGKRRMQPDTKYQLLEKKLNTKRRNVGARLCHTLVCKQVTITLYEQLDI